MLHPPGQTERNKIQYGCHTAYKDMRSMRKNRTVFNCCSGNDPGKNSGAYKRQNEFRVFNYAYMKFHSHSQQAPAEKGDKNITNAANNYRSQKTNNRRLQHFLLIPPKHCRCGSGAQKSMNRVKDVKQPGGSFRKPRFIKKKGDKT